MKTKLTKCRICKKQFAQANSFHRACSPGCAIALVAKDKSKKARKARKINRLKLEAIQPLSHWLKRAQNACNAYIRARDVNEPCVSCGTYEDCQYHAGHFLSRGARPELRFHPANIHKQCAQCNNFKSGNITEYRINLIKKVGPEMVDYLENFNNPQRLTIDDIKEIEKHYKELKKQVKS